LTSFLLFGVRFGFLGRQLQSSCISVQFRSFLLLGCAVLALLCSAPPESIHRLLYFTAAAQVVRVRLLLLLLLLMVVVVVLILCFALLAAARSPS